MTAEVQAIVTSKYELEEALVKQVVEVLGQPDEPAERALERALRLGAGQHEMSQAEQAINQKAEAMRQGELQAKQAELGKKWRV